MSDLILKEALEQYKAECREVLSEDAYNRTARIVSDWDDEWRTHLIGACVKWLAGKIRKTDAPFDWQDNVNEPYEIWDTQPLRSHLNEVRDHMEANNDKEA